jgi:hypothetical protein
LLFTGGLIALQTASVVGGLPLYDDHVLDDLLLFKSLNAEVKGLELRESG